ncbi:MAG: orotidine-5'-phosphate decarboxylase [Rhodothalassiaceae bacterium]
MAGPLIFCALDVPARASAVSQARALIGAVDGLKLGLEYFCAEGPAGVAAVAGLGLPLFLDLKLHDIPNTVAGALRAVRPLQPAFVTVHCAGGPAMVQAAVDAVAGTQIKLLGVTVLTSLDDADLADIGVTATPADQVRRLAELGVAHGLHGLVCSPAEVALLRRTVGPASVLAVPGIRPSGTPAGDQKRVMTPGQAAAAGADLLVIGRPITQAGDPAAAAQAIRAELV